MELVDYAVEGSVARICLNRPPVNALNSALIGDIEAAIALASDSTIRAVVIAGNPHFSAGADVARLVDAFHDGEGESLAEGLADVVRRLELLAKPTIAAISGYALGGGLELAMGADFRYVSEDARIGQPEILLGIIPGAGGTQRLPRLVGYQRAKELNMSGRHVLADEALAIGLADKLLVAEELISTAMTDATEWACGPTLGYAATKQAMDEGWGCPIEEGLAIERGQFNRVFKTADAKAGVQAFTAKEVPNFVGR